MPISLENRLRIRPAGFVSKKRTGALRILLIILPWMALVEVMAVRRTKTADK